MITKHFLLLVALVVLVAGCSSSMTKDIQIESEADPKANFSGYKTFTWLGSAEILNDPYGQWEPTPLDADAEVKYLLDRELRKRGLTQSTSSPDLLVVFGAGIDMTALELKQDPDTNEDVLRNIPEGGLLVALIDAESGFVIWAGDATADVLDNPDTDTVKKRLDYAVTQLIKQVPK